MVEMIRKDLCLIEKISRRVTEYIKRNWKTIAYYVSLAAVLMLIACAAESYRRRDTPAEKTASEDITEAVAVAKEKLTEEPPEKTPEFKFEIPDAAQRVKAFYCDPQWNDELAQWEIHTGEDYVFPDDTVKAFSDGTIEYLSQEESCIGIRSGSIYLMYKSVAPDETLIIGNEIKLGEKIGDCTDTLRGEGHMGRHLHLETTIDGVTTDFDSIPE